MIQNLLVAIHLSHSECFHSTVYPRNLLQELPLDLQVKPNLAVLSRIICLPCILFLGNIRRKAVENILHYIIIFGTVSHEFTLCFFCSGKILDWNILFDIQKYFFTHIFCSNIFSRLVLDDTLKKDFSKFGKDDLVFRAETFSSCHFSLCRNFDISNVCLSHFDVAMASIKPLVLLAKTQRFWDMPVMLFFSFLHQILQFHEFVRFISIVVWFCVVFLLSLKKFVKLKFTDPRWQVN